MRETWSIVSCPGLFEFEHVCVERDERTILDDVSRRILSCGITCLVGPSGSGKTTALRLLNGLEIPDDGRVLFDGDDIATLDRQDLRRRVGMVFQRPVLFGGSLRDNLAVARHGSDTDYSASLAEVGLDVSRLDSATARLSGGEAQRLCMARALRTRPEALLMDEPTSALDTDAKKRIESLARRLADDGMPVVWVSHDHDQVDRLANRVLELVDGKFVERRGGGLHAHTE